MKYYQKIKEFYVLPSINVAVLSIMTITLCEIMNIFYVMIFPFNLQQKKIIIIFQGQKTSQTPG